MDIFGEIIKVGRKDILAAHDKALTDDCVGS